MVGVRLSSTEKDTKVRVEISSTKLIKRSKLDFQVKSAGAAYDVFPTLEFDYDLLKSAREPFPETITFRIYNLSDLKDGKPTFTTRTVVVEVRAIYDCPYSRKTQNRVHNWRWMFAAYVNENHPVIDGLLQSALKHGVVDRFVGYQGDEQEVIKQVFAVWNVFQSRGIKYSSITTPSGESERVFSQHVRLISDSFQYQQANCVDGSVLFASVFRKIGLHPLLVTIPGHCFVGVYLDDKKTKRLFIETTMLGNVDLNKAGGSLGKVSGSYRAQKQHQASYQCFSQACGVGESNVKKYETPALRKDIYFIDIDNLRRMGLHPLSDDSHGSEKK